MSLSKHEPFRCGLPYNHDVHDEPVTFVFWCSGAFECDGDPETHESHQITRQMKIPCSGKADIPDENRPRL